MADQRITAGPSKFDLMLAVFERGKNVEFTVDGKQVEVNVSSILAEDGSRESWCLSGYIIGQQFKRYTAYFSTQRRTGRFTEVE